MSLVFLPVALLSLVLGAALIRMGIRGKTALVDEPGPVFVVPGAVDYLVADAADRTDDVEQIDDADEWAVPELDATPTFPELISTSVAAEMLGVSAATVRRLVADGELDATRDGRVIRIDRDDVLRLAAVR